MPLGAHVLADLILRPARSRRYFTISTGSGTSPLLHFGRVDRKLSTIVFRGHAKVLCFYRLSTLPGLPPRLGVALLLASCRLALPPEVLLLLCLQLRWSIPSPVVLLGRSLRRATNFARGRRGVLRRCRDRLVRSGGALLPAAQRGWGRSTRTFSRPALLDVLRHRPMVRAPRLRPQWRPLREVSQARGVLP